MFLINDATGKQVKIVQYNYPAGEVGVAFEELTELKEPLQMSVNLFNADDYASMMGILNHLRAMNITKYSIHFGFMAFFRQDKVVPIERDGVKYNEILMAPILLFPLLEYIEPGTKVTILDPHTDKLDNDFFNEHAFHLDISVIKPNKLQKVGNDRDFIPIFPDKGAAERYNYEGECIVCDKERDDTGTVKGLVISQGEVNVDANYCIYDDICDGGATFIAVAEAMKEAGHKGELHLFVTHGLFTKGFSELDKYFHTIRSLTGMHNSERVVTAKLQ